MSKEKGEPLETNAAARKIRYLRTSSLRDWVSSTALILSGVTAIWVAGNPAAWNRVVENNSQGIAVLQVVPVRGSVRVKRMNSSSWQDIETKNPGYEGDSVATGESGSAYLVLDQSTQIQVEPDSLVVVHVQNSKSENDSALSVWQDLADPHKKAASRSFLELKSGSLHVAASDSHHPVKVMAAGKIYKVKPNLKNTSTELALDPSASSLSTRRVAALTQLPENSEPVYVSAQRSIAENHPNLPPVITRPSRAAHFVIDKTSKVLEVSLCWEVLPEDAQGEVEVESQESSTAPISITGNRSCARATLPRGSYRWRVRSVSGEQKKSSFTVASTFDVTSEVPQVVRAVPVTPPPAPPAPPVVRDNLPEKIAARKRNLQIEAQRKQAEDLKRIEIEKENLRLAIIEKYQNIARAAQKRTGTLEQDAIDVEPVTLQSSQGEVASTSLKQTAADLNSVAVHLLWRPVPGAKQYDVTLYNNQDEVKTLSVDSARYDWVLKSIDPKVKLSYRVSTTTRSGRKIASAVTPITVEVAVPSLVLPGPGANVAFEKHLLFTWSRTAITQGYRFQIARNPDFSDAKTESVKENFYNYEIREPGIYYWRVAGFADEFVTGWSEVRSFTVTGKN